MPDSVDEFYIAQLVGKERMLETLACHYAAAPAGERLAARAQLLAGSLVYAAAHLAYHAAVLADAVAHGESALGPDTLPRASTLPVFQCGKCPNGSDDGIGWAVTNAGPLCSECARDAERCPHVDELGAGLRCVLRTGHEPPCMPPDDADRPAPLTRPGA